MRMRAIGAILMVLALGATPAFAGPDGSLDLFPIGVDPGTGAALATDFNACQVIPTPIFGGFGQKIIIGVYARLQGMSAGGISGAQFYVAGLETLPAGWTAAASYPLGTTQAYSANFLFTPRDVAGTPNRVQITTWSVDGPSDVDCQKAELTKVAQIDLQQIGLPAVLLPNDMYVSVVKAAPQVGALDCPILLQCDFPFYTQFCVTGGQMIINPVNKSCTVAVSETTWGGLKELYR